MPPSQTARSARSPHHVGKGIALEQNAADDAQKMGQRQTLAQDLGPAGHAAEGKHEARQQDGGQKEKERQLHGLELILATWRT